MSQVSGRRCQLGVKSEQGDQLKGGGGGGGDGWELLRDEREREKGFIFFWTPLGKSSGVGDGDRIIAKAFLGL